MVASAGADAIGLNFVASSRRVIDRATAAHIVEAVGHRVEIVAVVADKRSRELEELREATGIRWLQLHGAEAPEELELLLPDAFKAVPIGSAADAEGALRFGGSRVLVDKKTAAELGGTGQRFDWSLVARLAQQRNLILAGGLDPSNVADAVRELRPFGVDVASGVEAAGNPRQKEATKVHAFIAAVRAAETP